MMEETVSDKVMRISGPKGQSLLCALFPFHEELRQLAAEDAAEQPADDALAAGHEARAERHEIRGPAAL